NREVPGIPKFVGVVHEMANAPEGATATDGTWPSRVPPESAALMSSSLLRRVPPHEYRRAWTSLPEPRGLVTSESPSHAITKLPALSRPTLGSWASPVTTEVNESTAVPGASNF